MDKNMIMTIVMSAVGTLLVPSIIGFITMWILPKQKTGDRGAALANMIYDAIERLGNGKLGVKITDDLQQGPLVSIANFFIRFGQQLEHRVQIDKLKIDVEKKINPDISKAFNEAIK